MQGYRQWGGASGSPTPNFIVHMLYSMIKLPRLT